MNPHPPNYDEVSSSSLPKTTPVNEAGGQEESSDEGSSEDDLPPTYSARRHSLSTVATIICAKCSTRGLLSKGSMKELIATLGGPQSTLITPHGYLAYLQDKVPEREWDADQLEKTTTAENLTKGLPPTYRLKVFHNSKVEKVFIRLRAHLDDIKLQQLDENLRASLIWWGIPVVAEIFLLCGILGQNFRIIYSTKGWVVVKTPSGVFYGLFLGEEASAVVDAFHGLRTTTEYGGEENWECFWRGDQVNMITSAYNWIA